MKRLLLTALILLLAAGINTSVAGDKDEIYEIGEKVSDFKLKDIMGKEHSLHEILKSDDINAVVFVFVSKNCPVSNACDERYMEMAGAFKEKGVFFAGINSNKTESVEDIREAAMERKYNFPVLKDWNNEIADRFGAEYTPHAFMIDNDGVLVYKGRIDDNHRSSEKVNEKTLQLVVNEYLMGKDLSYTETKSNGCTIKRVKK